MIAFPAIWWLFPVASFILIFSSLYVIRSGVLENPLFKNAFVATGALFGFLALGLPFFEQPRLGNPLVNYAIGVPFTVLGLIGRVYPMIYLRRQGTTTTLAGTGVMVDSGPYGCVRHPQYTSGVVFLIGWFLAWGALYSLGLIPFIAGIVYLQALIEKRSISSRGPLGRNIEITGNGWGCSYRESSEDRPNSRETNPALTRGSVPAQGTTAVHRLPSCYRW